MSKVNGLPVVRVEGLLGRKKHRWTPAILEVKGDFDPYSEVTESGNIRLMKLPRKHEPKPFEKKPRLA